MSPLFSMNWGGQPTPSLQFKPVSILSHHDNPCQVRKGPLPSDIIDPRQPFTQREDKCWNECTSQCPLSHPLRVAGDHTPTYDGSFSRGRSLVPPGFLLSPVDGGRLSAYYCCVYYRQTPFLAICSFLAHPGCCDQEMRVFCLSREVFRYGCSG